MHLSFARVGPYYLNKLVSGELPGISCETEGAKDSNVFVESQLYNGREFTFDFRYDEIEKQFYKVVVTVENLKKGTLSGGVTRYFYELRLKEVHASFKKGIDNELH